MSGPTGSAGLNTLSVSNFGASELAGSRAHDRDAFGRARVSDVDTVFASKLLGDSQPIFWDDQETSGSGTASAHSSARASSTLSVSNATAGARVRQTRRHIQYQPGKSQHVMMTYVLGEAAAGIVRRVGQFNEGNGAYIEQNGADEVNIVIRSSVSGSPVETKVEQSDWNQDSLDGTGPSGETLDLSKLQVFGFDYQWLGGGRVRFGFWFGEKFVEAHHAFHANLLDSVWMSTPNLPLRYELSNDGTGPAATLEAICATVASEGGQERTGIVRTIDRGIAGFATKNDTAIYPIIAIRLGSGHLGAQVRPVGVSMLSAAAADYRWILTLNPTITGDALSFSPLANSGVEVQTDTDNATTITDEGVVLASGYQRQTSSSLGGFFLGPPTEFRLGSLIDGTSDVMVLAVQNLSSGSETYFGSFAFMESH